MTDVSPGYPPEQFGAPSPSWACWAPLSSNPDTDSTTLPLPSVITNEVKSLTPGCPASVIVNWIVAGALLLSNKPVPAPMKVLKPAAGGRGENAGLLQQVAEV